MYNLRKDRKINKISVHKSKSKTITNKKLANMPTVENSELYFQPRRDCQTHQSTRTYPEPDGSKI